MKTVIQVTILSLLVVTMLALIIKFSPQSQTRVIDCGMASFHPDYTAQMRKACNQRFIKL